MISARADFTATLLPDGKVLVAGGVTDANESTALASAELYDPTTGSWAATGSMITPRSRHSATLLADGRVLVAGGYCPYTTVGCPAKSDPVGAIAEAELYDPETGTWAATGRMTTERFLHTATLLQDGRVLVAGAEHGMPDAILDSTELYDPKNGTWSASAAMTVGRTQQFATLLGDGSVLLAGGIGPISPTEHDVLNSAEVFDARGQFTPTGNLVTARAQGGTVALLSDGQVLLAGGDGPGDPMLASAELYDPSTRIWHATGAMPAPRAQSASVVLSDGSVLVVGGFSNPNDGLLTSAVLYEPELATWTSAGEMQGARMDATATLLPDGTVLVAGGFGASGPLSTAEIYDASPGTASSGRIVFEDAGANFVDTHVWIEDAGGSKVRQLVSDTYTDGAVSLSTDGTRAVFYWRPATGKR